MLNLPLISSRLLLRDFCADDLPAYQALRGTPGFGRHAAAGELSPAYAAMLLQRFIEQQRPPRRAWQLAIARRDNGELIGSVDLRGSAAPGVASFGLELAEAAWGLGLAQEAGSMVLDAAFNALGLRRIEADTAETNRPARKLAARLGFVEAPARNGRVPLALSLGMLGAESDWRLEGSALQRQDGCWRLLSPGQADFYHGNALLLDQPPALRGREYW